ncbi:tRNA-dihydrouridine(20) synthase [NAD(P)+]-like [Physella acuta]|uniref:tRNA-dihydrouridine(20) synthase [NAD(P)+]-like n=1 Tax=Physella acuta TaxID=109671 RepID=UPI0027DACB21|nr:tRNA-dihydrouridine(20) synthase [NAD(P)+]-like [Physella acuta]XP_059164980.1 tRNA-dihydrouridine(20) synthase [NAD(P)+]-like [Physella acuta]XP_059164982.1 tRNA-dihydrouridine(20) synthase [NAD(P)+]-like [Physella acuta]XP_059164983.1 tRNA-dihydrouridine(20) synthase [NAD(P)+]-like [Physella acuta]XP_059164984.1 tRNA-dihydrouridine(20) synthase [NAD(P)+]-like [Physella acuta]
MGNERNENQYRSKFILAPMVRVCTLPMRLLALDYGADLVYTEEIIDRKVLLCQEYKNELLGTTDYVMSDGTVVFRTSPIEKDKIIFQLGTADAKRALAAAKKIQHLVAGVDINMGCPKEFSVKGGMGAALLTQPEKIKDILTTLVNELDVPVTCKIRVLPSVEKTVELAKLIESTGVSALGVHGRTKEERSRDPNRDDYIKAVANAVSIPVIANGGSKRITCYEDIEEFRKSTGASSVMLARAAMWNCSVFRKEGTLDFLKVLKSYLTYAFQYDNNEMNTKYAVLQILHDKMLELPEADGTLTAKSLQDFADIWCMQEEYKTILQKRREKEKQLNDLAGGDCRGVKKRKAENGLEVIELPVRFDKRIYSTTMTPKQILNNYCKKCQKGKPVYTTVERPDDRFFHSTVLVDQKLYTNPFWERAKQLAEQSAAVCYLVVNGQHDGRLAEPHNETEELRQKWRGLLNSDLSERTWSPVKDCVGTENPSLSETESKENGNIENGDLCPQLDDENAGKITDGMSRTIVDQR